MAAGEDKEKQVLKEDWRDDFMKDEQNQVKRKRKYVCYVFV